MKANKVAANEEVWGSVYKLQTTKSDEEEAANQDDSEQAVEEVEWSIGKITMINLWAMLLVCLCGNALICWIASMGKKRTAYFARNEHDSV